MRYIQILQDAFDLAKTSKFVLLYLFVSLILGTIPQTQSDTELALICAFTVIRLTLLVLTTIFLGGFIYSISEKFENEVDISIRDGFLRAQSYVFKIIILLLIVSIPFLLAYAIFWIVLNSVAAYFAAIIFGLFLMPIGTFGSCALIIDDRSVLKSISTSILVLGKNFIPAIFFSTIFLVLQYLLSIFFIWLLASAFDPQNLLQLGLNYQTLQIPLVGMINQIIRQALIIIQTSFFTLIFLYFRNRASIKDVNS